MSTRNGTTCGVLDPLFPDPPPNPTPLLANDVAALVVQCLPVASVLLAWCAVECRGRDAAVARSGGRATFARLVFLLASSARSVLVWRTFELFECEGQFDVDDWAFVAVLADAAASMVLSYSLLSPSCDRRVAPRAACTALLLLAAACVVLDWCLRGGIATSDASHPLVALQQTYALQAVVSLQFAPPRRRRAWTSACQTTAVPSSAVRRVAHRERVPVLNPIDALARRVGADAPANVTPCVMSRVSV